MKTRAISCGRRRPPRAAIAAAVGILLAACGYQPVGTTGPPGSGQQLYVEAITNETMRPGIEGVVGAAVRQELQRRGVVQGLKAAPTPPDLILSGGVTSYLNEPITFGAVQDIGRRFRVRVTLLATLTRRTDGQVRFQEAITGEAYYTAGAGAVAVGSAENEALRFAAQDLANKLVARLVEEW